MVYLRQYICYPVNVCVFPFNFNMQNDRIMKKLNFGLGTTSKAVSEYDQEIPQSQTADNPMAPRRKAAQPSQDIRKTN